MIAYQISCTCRACGRKFGCAVEDWSEEPPTCHPSDCETGKELERCPHCGEGGRWWEEEAE